MDRLTTLIERYESEAISYQKAIEQFDSVGNNTSASWAYGKYITYQQVIDDLKRALNGCMVAI